MASINFDDLVSDSEYKVPDVPAGEYSALVKFSRAEKSKNDNDMLTAKLEITEGPCKGEELWARLVYTERSQKHFVRKLKALGVVPTGVKSFEDLADEIDGNVTTIVVKMGEYQGQKRPEVDDFKPAAAGSVASKGDSPF